MLKRTNNSASNEKKNNDNAISFDVLLNVFYENVIDLKIY